MSVKFVIPSTTEAVETRVFEANIGAEDYFPLSASFTIYTWDLQSDETVEIQFPTDRNEMPWITARQLTSDDLFASIFSSVKFRIVKPKTTNAVGVAIAEKRADNLE